ncbi:MAG: tRNA (guanosine(37)-N1)-methyltransferase TrmD [Candidatus Eremiobacteraeota bacterium]|nr:tRNA (guanosine(37)-N1)-methyltransferase TrmD [Candidatus Eremiobacteraeota bacterium]
MRIDVITLFPEVFTPLEKSIIRRARDAHLVKIHLHNLRDYTDDRHRTVDDAPYGGGAGMILKIEPLFKALDRLQKEEPRGRVILLSPQGQVFTQARCRELAGLSRLILVAGHYEGIDERVTEHLADEELSIGDYVLTGGELPAMVVIDAVVRLIPGVIDSESAALESFDGGLLDYPHYTRPSQFRGWSVPEVLLSGNHALIGQWRNKERVRRTALKRPDLLEKLRGDEEIGKFYQQISDESNPCPCAGSQQYDDLKGDCHGFDQTHRTGADEK